MSCCPTFLSHLLPHQADPARFAEIYGYSIVLLRFVAIYCLFDTMNIIFCSAIKGAGDTRYVMMMTTMLSIYFIFTFVLSLDNIF